jgi:kynurenine formamidase
MDMPSVHYENYMDVHHILLKAEILIVEGLNNLGQLTENHIFFVALPLRIKVRDGSPCRAIAIEGFTENDLKMFNND